MTSGQAARRQRDDGNDARSTNAGRQGFRNDRLYSEELKIRQKLAMVKSMARDERSIAAAAAKEFRTVDGCMDPIQIPIPPV